MVTNKEEKFFGKTREELDRLYRKALKDGRYIKVFKGKFTPADVKAYKRNYPLGEVTLSDNSAVVVVMPSLGSLTTYDKLYEFIQFYVRNELPQDLQGYISVTKTSSNTLQVAFLSKGVDVGLRVLDSKFATHWDLLLVDEYTCTIKTTFSNTGLPLLDIKEESIYYIIKKLSDLMDKDYVKLEKLIE